MNLIVAGVRLMHGEPVEIASYVTGSTRVGVPIVVAGGCYSRSALFRGIIFIVPVPASLGTMPKLTTNLTFWSG